MEHHAQFGNIFKGQDSTLSGLQVIENISVPKKDLVDAGKVMIQQGRLRVAPGRWKDDFKEQLQRFKGKVNEKTKNIKYEAETEAVHDDLVVVFLMGAWWVLNRREKGAQERTAPQSETYGFEPFDYC